MERGELGHMLGVEISGYTNQKTGAVSTGCGFLVPSQDQGGLEFGGRVVILTFGFLASG